MTKGKKILVVSSLALLFLIATPGTASAETFIKKWEADGNPFLTAIPDAKGRWQVGFGSTWHYDLNRWVKPGDKITTEQAYRFMRNEINEKAKLIKDVVIVPLTANMRTALISLSYNIGSTAFTGSTLLDELNAGLPKQVVAEQFQYWRIANGQISQGLVNRRAAEKKLFLS